MAILTILYSFNGSNYYAPAGSYPRGTLLMDEAGDLFGTASSGGVNGYGTVFELANTGSGYATAATALVSFNYGQGSAGTGVDGTVVMDGAGDLFGFTRYSAANGGGALWEIGKTSTGYATTPTVLVNLPSPPDSYTYATNLVMDSAGNLFGEMIDAYTNAGSVFEVAKTATGYASTVTTLASFDKNSGESGQLVVDAAGNLFGATYQGGTNGNSTVFEIAKTATGYAAPTTLAQTAGAGADIQLMDSAGDLFGTTSNTVFELVKTAAGYASTPITLVSGHAYPGNLVMDGAGNLYGTDVVGNDYVIFEIAKTATGYASTQTTVFDFGNKPAPNGLTLGASGTIYGTEPTSSGGIIFEVVPPITLSVSITGTAQEGQTLTATPSEAVASYQWQELVGSNWTNIAGATGATYLVQSSNDGWQIRVQVADLSGNTAISAASNAVLDVAGNQSVYDSANQTTIGNGLHQSVYGTATNTTVNSGGEQDIFASGVANYTTLNAGSTEVDWGTANNTTLNGGNQYVWGTANVTTVNSGMQSVGAGASATATTIYSGGEQVIDSGGTASRASVSGQQFVYGSADGTVVTGTGFQNVYGSVTNTTVASGGGQNIYAGGTATGTTLAGTEVDWGSDTNTTVNGGSQYVWGTADNTTVNSGLQSVGNGGSATAATIYAGGQQVIDEGGTATGTTLNNGIQYVYGGTVSDTTINWGGGLFVEAGGTSSNTTINNGGEYVWGGTAQNATFGNLGASILSLEQSSAFTGSISGFQLNDTIDLKDILYDPTSTTLGYSPNSGNTGGTLTVTDGTTTATLNLLGQYSAASFALSSDGHGGTFITDPPAQQAQSSLVSPLHS